MTAVSAGPGTGTVVSAGLGVEVQVRDDPFGLGLAALAGLALRDNPRRAHLVVSTVLGKHVPVAPGATLTAGRRLGGLVARALPAGPAPLVLGYCETATALGHLVAQALPGAHYAHTTRRPDRRVAAVGGFDEEHSHAVAHTLQLADPTVLDDPARPVVLVDDELTTGTTALNTVAALSSRAPHDTWVVATLLDLRTDSARSAFAARAAALGVRVEVVALLSGTLALPDDVLDRAAALRAALGAVPPAAVPAGGGPVVELPGHWPAGLPTGGRTGVAADALEEPLADLVAAVGARLTGGPVVVLGTEELMWLPLRLAAGLAEAGHDVVWHSTTRSPVLPADLPGYAVRRALTFPAPDEPDRLSRLHGLPDAPYADVVVVVDAPLPQARPLAEALRPWATGRVLVVGV